MEKLLEIPSFLDLSAQRDLERNSRERFSVAKFPGNNNRVDISALSARFTRKSREIDSVPPSVFRTRSVFLAASMIEKLNKGEKVHASGDDCRFDEKMSDYSVKSTSW